MGGRGNRGPRNISLGTLRNLATHGLHSVNCRTLMAHMHFHDLRHSAATILLSMGVNMKVIQELLGHSDVAITLGLYSHLLSSMQKDVMSKWDDVFGSDDKDKDLG